MLKAIYSFSHFILFLLASSICFSQAFETRNYEWQNNPAVHKLSESELKEPSVILKDQRYIEYTYSNNNNNKDQLAQYYTRHRIIHICEQKAIEQYNRIYIPVYSPEQLITFKARSISKNGQAKEMLKGDMKEITEKGQHYMILAVDGLERDGELEYFYTLQRTTSFFGTETMQSASLTKDCGITIISPENLVFESKSYNGYPALQDTLIGRKRFLKALMPLMNPSNEEKYSIYEASLMRVEFKLVKNTANGDDRLFTWADAGNKYYARLTTLEKGEQKDVEKLVSKLKLKSFKTEEEKIRIIENFVKTTISLQENSEARTISDILKMNYGSEFGIRQLCIAMLKQAGVSFEIVLTCNRFERKFDPDFDSWNYLEEIFLYFPSIDQYMDPTDFVYRLGLIPFQYAGASALFIKEVGIGEITSGVSAIKKIPEPRPGISYNNLDVDVRFSSDMKQVTQHVHQTYAGYLAIGTRPYYFYLPEDKRSEITDAILKGGIEDTKLSNVHVSNFNLSTDEVNKDFIIDADLTSTSLLEKAGDTYLFKVGTVIGPQVEMYQEKPRQRPADIEFPHSYQRKISVAIPDGYTPKGLEALNININGGKGYEEAMAFVSNYKVSENNLEITVKEFYYQLNYPLSVFEQFRKVINASADFNKISIVLEKK